MSSARGISPRRRAIIVARSNRWQCEDLGVELGLSVTGHNPGGGTKVRVFQGLDRDYFDGHCIFATAGKPGDWLRCLDFLEGYKSSYQERYDQGCDEGYRIGYADGLCLIPRQRV